MNSAPTRERKIPERNRHGHELCIQRIGWMIDRGHPVYVIARARDMPRADTIWHLIVSDSDLRRRYEEASALRRARIADETVLLTDRLTDDSRSGRRLRIAVRKWRADIERDGPVGRPMGGSGRSRAPLV